MCEERSLLRHYLSAVYTPEGVDVVMTSPLRDFASRTVNDVLREGSSEDISHLMGWADSAATAGGDVTDSGQERAAANLAYHGHPHLRDARGDGMDLPVQALVPEHQRHSRTPGRHARRSRAPGR